MTFNILHIKNGFTVLELLIVIGLIVAVTAAGLILFKPDEFLKERRDEKRIKEIEELKRAVDAYVDSGTGTISLGTPNVVYASGVGTIKDKSGDIVKLKTQPQNTYATNGLGWLPVNFDTIANKTRLSALPQDPVNQESHVFTFANDGETKYKLTVRLESQKYQPKMSDDCGSNPDRYEVGTNCELSP